MTGEESMTGIQSIEDALSLLHRGNHFVVCSPTSELALQLVTRIVARLQKGKATLLSFAPVDFELNKKKLHGTVELSQKESPSQIIGLIKERIEEIPDGGILLVCIPENHPSLFSSPEKQQQVVSAVLASSRRRSIASIWFVRQHALLANVLLTLKNESDYFLQISRIGTLNLAQFIHARGEGDAQFFLPRILTLSASGTALSSFSAMSLNAKPGEADENPIDAQYRAIFESAPEAMILFELWGGYRAFNKRGIEVLGYEEKDLAKMTLKDLVPAEKLFHTVRSLILLKRKGKLTFSTQALKRSGRPVEVEVRASLLGKNTFLAVCADISERVRSEAALTDLSREYSSFVEALPYPFAVFINRRLSAKNGAFDLLFPFLGNDAPSVTDFFGRRNADLLKEIGTMLEDNHPTSAITNREVHIPERGHRPGRETVATEVSISVIRYGGKRALYCSFVDVSARRRILDSAAAAEEKFTTLVEESIDAISISVENRFVLLNGRFSHLFRHDSVLDLLGKDVTVVVARGTPRAEVIEHYKNAMETKEASTRFRYVGAKKDGKKIFVEAQASRITFDGKPALLVYHRDVTQSTEAEEALSRKARSLDILNRISDEIASAKTVEEVYQGALSAAMRATGYETGAVLLVERASSTMNVHVKHNLSENAFAKLNAQSLDESFARFFSKTHEPVIVSIAEYPPHLPYKSLFESEQFQCLAFLPVVVHQQLFGVLFLGTSKQRSLDDTGRAMLASLCRHLSLAIERGQLVEHVKEVQGQLNATIEKISDVLYELGPSGNFEFITPNIESVIGFTLADFKANANLWRTLLHPDDRPIISQRISNQTQSGNDFQIEYRMLPKGKASYVWLRDNFRYQRDAHGALVNIRGILSDITAVKRLAELAGGIPAPQAEVRGDRGIVACLPEGIAAFDMNLVCVEWNTALERIMGIDRDDAMGKKLSELPSPASQLLDPVERVLSSNKEVTEGIPLNLPMAQHQGTFSVRVSPWMSEDGDTIGAIALLANTSSARQREKEITQSEDLLRNVINTMADALLISDLHGEVWEVNRAFTQLTGYEREEVRRSGFPYPWLYEGEVTPFIRWMSELLEKEHLHDLDMTWLHKNGHYVAVSLNTTLLRDVDGEPLAVLNIARDITERRKLSVELEWKSRELEVLNRIISFANTTMDIEKIFSNIASETHSLIPFDGIAISVADERRELRPTFLATPTDAGNWNHADPVRLDAATVRRSLEEGKPLIHEDQAHPSIKSQISIPMMLDRRALGVFSLVSSRQNAFTNEEMEFLLPVAEQAGTILERVRLFELVKEDSAYIHNLLNSINHVVCTVDSSYRITDVNNAWGEFMRRQGLDEWSVEEKIIGQSLEAIVPNEKVWNHYTTVMDDLFAQRIEQYSGNIEVTTDDPDAAYHLTINPMLIKNKVTGLVLTFTDITEMNRSEAEIKQRNKELIALNTIATSIGRSLQLDEVLRFAADQVRKTFERSCVMLHLLNEENNALVLSGHSGLPPALQSNLQTIAPDDTIHGNVMASRTSLFVASVQEARELLAVASALNARSMAIIPLQMKGRGAGTITICFLQQHEFNEKEQQLLILIGNQLSSAIENAQLYSEIKEQVKTLTTLYQLGKGLTGALDLNSALQVVYREVEKALPLERFYYQAYSPENNTLSLLSRMVHGVGDFYPAGVKVRGLDGWPNTIYQDVVQSGKSYVGSTSSADDDSMVAVPIRSDDKVLGIISIVTSAPKAYSDVHLRLLESIANLTGVAVVKASLYEDTLKKSREIENRNKELDDFTYVVSHDLKEPLISIEGYSKIVLKDSAQNLDPEGREYLGTIVQSTTRMKHLIEDLLTLSRVGRMKEGRQVVSVAKIVDEILHDLQFSLKEKNVFVSVQENLPNVHYNGTRLSMVLRNLIANAMKFNDKPNPTIEIRAGENEHEHIFSIADNGIGIEPKYFDKIFTIFQRLRRSEEYRGTGAGLTITKRIVELEGGRIWLESEPGKGSTFFFTVLKTA